MAQPARRAKGRSPESREGHPTHAPYAQSLCFRCASLLRGLLTVHPWTGSKLAHVLWAILRTIPAQPRHVRRDPYSARPARQSKSRIKSALIPLRGLLPLNGRRKGHNLARFCCCFVFAVQEAQ